MSEISKDAPIPSAGSTGLSSMAYPGRGIMMGMTPNGTPIVGYVLSGRSPSSKARMLYHENKDGRGVIATRATDEEVLKKGNPALLIYPVIIFDGQKIAISNGVQTELVMSAPLPEALRGPVLVNNIDITSYEPDAPNYTPRIAGELNFNQQNWVSVFHIVRRAHDSSDSIRETYRYELEPGIARIMTTYAGGNESPLLPFARDPMETAIVSNNPQELCRNLFSMLREDYRVSAVVLTWASVEYGNVSILNASDDTGKPQNSQVYLRSTPG
jgi:IMP cyclohydrolase